MTALLIVTLLGAVVGFIFSSSSVIDAMRERRQSYQDVEAPLSERLETKRHVIQQAIRMIKLLLLAAVLLLAILERPEDAEIRTVILRSLLIGVIFLVIGSAIHEKFANRKIVWSIIVERRKRYAEWEKSRTTHTEE